MIDLKKNWKLEEGSYKDQQHLPASCFQPFNLNTLSLFQEPQFKTAPLFQSLIIEISAVCFHDTFG